MFVILQWFSKITKLTARRRPPFAWAAPAHRQFSNRRANCKIIVWTNKFGSVIIGKLVITWFTNKNIKSYKIQVLWTVTINRDHCCPTDMDTVADAVLRHFEPDLWKFIWHICCAPKGGFVAFYTLWEWQRINGSSLYCIHTCWQFLAATKQLYKWYFPSVCPSVCHTFLTMFPLSYHHEIFRSYYQWPK